MAVGKKLFLDFLDFATADSRPLWHRYEERDLRLRYELLASPESDFVVAAPAIAKCDETAFLLAQYPELWATGRLVFALDAKHSGSAESYFRSRMSKLESAIDEHDLASHFEYRGYSAEGWRVFFGPYMDSVAGKGRGSSKKVADGDAAFRSSVRRLLLDDGLEEYLAANGAPSAARLLAAIDSMVDDAGALFQREQVVARLQQESLLPLGKLTDILHMQLDVAFADANAESAGCSLASEDSRVDGRLLRRIAPHVFVGRESLAAVIERIKPITVLELSRQSEWRIFLSCLEREINLKVSELGVRRRVLLPALRGALPGRRYGVLQSIGAMIVAYLVSPMLGTGAVSRLLGAVFTDLPSWVMAGLNRFANRELTTSIIELSRKLPRLATLDQRVAQQSLAAFGLHFTSTGLQRLSG